MIVKEDTYEILQYLRQFDLNNSGLTAAQIYAGLQQKYTTRKIRGVLNIYQTSGLIRFNPITSTYCFSEAGLNEPLDIHTPRRTTPITLRVLDALSVAETIPELSQQLNTSPLLVQKQLEFLISQNKVIQRGEKYETNKKCS